MERAARGGGAGLFRSDSHKWIRRFLIALGDFNITGKTIPL